jgi:hypothetical protein
MGRLVSAAALHANFFVFHVVFFILFSIFVFASLNNFVIVRIYRSECINELLYVMCFIFFHV